MFEKLIKFENELKFQSKEESSIQLSDDEIDQKYLEGEMRMVTEQARYPLNTIKDLVSSENYELHPEFQRRNRWSQEKKSKLIESLIINVPIPPIFLYEQDYSKYEVLDGLQRLSAIKEYYADEYELQGLEFWSALNGRCYSQLPEQIRKGIDRRYLSSIILLKETAKNDKQAKELKQMVFARINSGGAKLEDQEARNAQTSSRFNDLLQKLSRDNTYCEIFDIPLKTADEDLVNDQYSLELRDCEFFRTMKDVETVLRFFALRNSRLWANKTLTKYLDEFTLSMQDVPDEILCEYDKLFTQTIELAYNIYGDKTFCLYKINRQKGIYLWTKRPVVFIYDCIMVALSKLLGSRQKLIDNADSIKSDTLELFKCSVDLFNGRNTSKSNFIARVNAFQQLFGRYVK